MSLAHRTPWERRMTARHVRRHVRTGMSMTNAAELEQTSRAAAYRFLAELEEWESKATDIMEAAEINGWYPPYVPDKWLMCSGRLLTAYAKGEADPSLMGDRNAAPQLGIDADPLMD